MTSAVPVAFCAAPRYSVLHINYYLLEQSYTTQRLVFNAYHAFLQIRYTDWTSTLIRDIDYLKLHYIKIEIQFRSKKHSKYSTCI
jgi:hypothetical protein